MDSGAFQVGGMNSSVTELTTTQKKLECIDNDKPSNDCGSAGCGDHPSPSGTSEWRAHGSDVTAPGAAPNPHQHAMQSEMMDSLSLRFHCPCQSTQCQLSNLEYLMEPQSSQYHLLTGPVPGQSDSSDHSSVTASWFTNEPIVCSMVGDFHPPVAGICVPQAMDHLHLHDGVTEFTSHSTQPVVCNVSGGEQVVLVNPCEPEPVFLTLQSAPQYEDYGPCQEKGVSVLGTLSQLPQYHQTSCPLHVCRDQTANKQPRAPPAQTVGASCESKSKKPCHCTRSQCLKLYCECFANGVMCSNCDCSNCHNNPENEMKRQKAIKSCLGRNPDAFRSKTAAGGSGDVKGWHSKGCNCKRSRCLKSYCECYEANIRCTSSCKCVGCGNYDDGSGMDIREKTANVSTKYPASVVTPAVVEAVCGCLLAQAELAEREAQSLRQAQHMVLDEFGHCVTQIVKAMFENSDPSDNSSDNQAG